jgi:23S rRNA (cytidine1920-2'-O)/16S rRNA (cytidine1409-2'-O)-methyltransferase
MRADQLLVSQGLAPTRSAAQRLIAGAAVQWRAPSGWSAVAKASAELSNTAELRITDDAETRYASRGGLKLAAALAHTRIDVTGAHCLDVGQSTGGFTDVLLQAGAAHITGVDVGHGQLVARLRADPRVLCVEGVNARALVASQVAAPEGGFAVIVGDVSFISLTLVLPAVARLLRAGGSLLHLVKPQFELQPEQLARGGIVKDAALFATVEARVRQACTACGLQVREYFPSAIEGGDGNREFFVWAQA